jgi:hypothetical protein
MSTLKTNNVQVGQSVTATNNFTWYQPSTPDGTVRLGVGNTGATTADVVTANSSGNVGIGVTPSAWNTVTALQVKNAHVGGYVNNGYFGTNCFYDGAWKYIATGTAHRMELGNGTFQWYQAASGTAGNAITFTQAMTLDSSGNFLIGQTASSGSGKQEISFPVSSAVGFRFNMTDTTYNNAVMEFRTSAPTRVGYIYCNASSTAYNTSSDYRLKDRVAPIAGALAKVALLKPVTYKWKVDDSDGEGFIAHELAEVCPLAVTGEKDAVDADGNPVYQGIDTSFLVATLTAAIQEQQALITSLTARIAALETK